MANGFKYLIKSEDTISEWLLNFGKVQLEMNLLEHQGIVSGVVVQRYLGTMLDKEFTYDFNGEEWERRKENTHYV